MIPTGVSSQRSANVFLALGSNLGARAANLYAALDALSGHVRIQETSFLYETPPAYVTDQPPFLNAVCRLTTRITPTDLLTLVKQIELRLGRRKTVRYGPRIIDLDLLFYDDLRLESDHLTLPHPRLAERDFVLQPLMDIAPTLRDPSSGRSIRELYTALDTEPLPRVLPVKDRLIPHSGPTRVMGILNVTRDSFSGDGLLGSAPDPVERALTLATEMVAQGAGIIDVGGQSTRPGHTLHPEEEEISRIEPVIRALSRNIDAPISVDTFRSAVAQAALDAGAHMVNDVWGLRYDGALASLVARRHVPLVVMHNHQTIVDPDYAECIGPHLPPGAPDPVRAIWTELQQQLNFAQAAGVSRWQLIADPGIGFGKSPATHMQITRRLNELVELGYPVLYGASRKGFIRRLLGDLPPEERDAATAALSALAAERGATIVRVHDVQQTVHAVRMADAVMGRFPVPDD